MSKVGVLVGTAVVVFLGAVAAVPHAASSRPYGGAVLRPSAFSQTTAAARGGVAMASSDAKAVVDTYCVTCHNARTNSGSLSLDGVDLADVRASADTLERVVRKMGTGAMPPQGMPRPDRATHDAFVGWIADELDRAGAAQPNPGRSVLRRLNRTEYANAVRDLLDLNVDVSALLPVDNSSYGFDNIADVLGVSPVLMERYLTAGRRISAVAVGNAAEIPVTAETYRTRPDLSQDRSIDGLPLGTRGGLLLTHTFPVDAEYVFRVFPLQTTVSNVRGLQYAHEVIVLVDGAEVARHTIGGREDFERSMASPTESLNEIHERLTFRIPVTAGPREIGVTFVQRTPAIQNATLQPYLRTTWDPVDYLGVPHIERLTLTGPYNVTGPGDTPSRRRVFSCRPSTAADEAACATEILSTVARRAYRRPLTGGDLSTLLQFYEAGRAKGTFDAGIEFALRRVLASPDFVFRLERDPAEVRAGAVYPVSDVELASRLSFFLWSSIPDDQLLQLAEQGRLRDESVLETQIRRMLADSKAQALVDNFAGQWLYLRNLRSFSPDPSEFPDYDHVLRAAQLRELELFFGSVMRDDDRSVVDLMTADYTFVNERLARHYGIPDVYGSHFRRVTLARDERRGLLGKGAILAVTSYPTRTSPVIRGKWILENIVGTPPPPPPPDVDTNLKETPPGHKPRSLRERLEEHRQSPTCAGCHRLMDPIGFALEPFDATGLWRTSDEGLPIDGAGQLASGERVDGPASLRRALVADPEIFVTTVTEKLMIYALGRGLGGHDGPAVRGIVRGAARTNYSFSSLVAGLARSVPFQMRVKAGGEMSAAE